MPPHFSVQERAHALAISYETSACMREVNCITVTDLTRTINSDLVVGRISTKYKLLFLPCIVKKVVINAAGLLCTFFIRTINKVRFV